MSQEENKNVIVFQGLPGAYSHLACKHAMPDMEPVACRTFRDAFAAVKDGDARLAMIPIENSVAGRVADIHHLLPDSGLQIIGEHYERVSHHLLAVKGTDIGDVTHVHSHVHALPQCQNLIHELGIEAVVHVDTAGAAAEIAEKGDKTQAAIASSLAGEIYGLDALRSGVEDAEHNTTRFVIMSRDADVPPADTPASEVVTSFVFRVRNVPAALYKAMGGFATNGINMTKLESYVDGDFIAAQFYADVEGHPDHPGLKFALEELDFFTHEVTMLGTYRAAAFRKRVNGD
ncbi:MAG: prephenate dehydratase [Rhodospirillales bacterium]|jgi:prephenate dehydratase|nr:prephenate dehydratase [Rhodospirillales bacterium]MBT4039230.1 prephenate dehydratase [Rhodospirillales bacterium]MBT4626942.1 prephenate dehydratase [Rhodospirillales bacterium]MBT5350171.1 prephenate dehydratase [Rhodospirillales bacterium]MBT5521081.1 prephenate dehydratase [Rhodospirillales bacterium]